MIRGKVQIKWRKDGIISTIFLQINEHGQNHNKWNVLSKLQFDIRKDYQMYRKKLLRNLFLPFCFEQERNSQLLGYSICLEVKLYPQADNGNHYYIL